jgi:hypothetical protein
MRFSVWLGPWTGAFLKKSFGRRLFQKKWQDAKYSLPA